MSDPVASLIPGILLFGAITLWWHGAVRALDRARAAAQRFCQRQQWQLIDQTVSLARLRPRRGGAGWMLVRTYRFEVSPDGRSRCPGGLVLHGARAVRIWADGPDGRVIEALEREPGRPG